MKSLYSSPMRVYLCLGLLALVGIVCAMGLPVSLFPNSSKPRVGISIGYGSGTAESFLSSYGRQLEGELKAIDAGDIQVDKVSAKYEPSGVSYKVEFKWGVEPKSAVREVNTVINAFRGRVGEEIQNSISVWSNNESGGFFALALYSPNRSLDELYKILEPLYSPKLGQVEDAEQASLYNPNEKEITVELQPEKMAALGLLPRDIESAIRLALAAGSGGSITVGSQMLTIQMPQAAASLEQLSKIVVTAENADGSQRVLHLGDVARIDYGLKTSSSRGFRTNGAESLILFASPKSGGNVKRMSEELLAIHQELAPSFPKDVQSRVLVDPSEFIRSSVNNVFKEVAIGAGLAVVVLFLFIGSVRNVVTAAIEIPLSMILAFILMKMSGMNLNLISLGGLALSAGMNVDASVVVMENIFRHVERARSEGRVLDYAGRLALIVRAVSEVRFALIAATIASLVVFLPLAFTSDLSYAVLGDLAKTVVFSHGFSAFVALILVPTVRLQLMNRAAAKSGPTGQAQIEIEHSPIEGKIQSLEKGYGRWMTRFLESRKAQLLTYAGTAALLVALLVGVLPRLPKEVIGKPDTDWIILGVNTKGQTLLKQMETVAADHEGQLLEKFGDRILYTFTQIHGSNSSMIMARLKDKSIMRKFKSEMEEAFANTPTTRYWVDSWNPAELELPDPPAMRLVVRGGTLEERAKVTEQITELLESKTAFPRIWTEVASSERLLIQPNWEQWSSLRANGLAPSDLADLARVASVGRRVGELDVEGKVTEISMRYPEGLLKTPEDLGSLPVGVAGKVVPLRALGVIEQRKMPPAEYREDQRALFVVWGRHPEEEKSKDAQALQNAKSIVEEWKKSYTGTVSLFFEDPAKDLTVALRELTIAVGLSMVMILLVLTLQFGSLMNALLTLVAVPLGFVGVLISLWVFGSTLSLNSVLGVILLNGIAVGNSIILVDFLKRRVDEGMPPRQAAREAAEQRLRPILITSLTTILGMMPIALGFGDGGRILQPLGIAVSGGLWVSMALTLLIVPALQVSYLERRARKKLSKKQRWNPPFADAPTPLTHELLPEASALGADEAAARKDSL